MKVKNQQIYENDCGICAIKNILDLYKIDYRNVDINYHVEGISSYDMKNYLQKYFKKVSVISFNINEIKKVKQFKPYITLIMHNDVGHYVVVYKKSKKYLYILDSLMKYSYKISYENFEKIDGKLSIIIEDDIKINTNTNYSLLFIMFIFSFVSSIFLLANTILIQQIIDNGIKDAFLFIIVQVISIIITRYKIHMFLSMFKKIDSSLILNCMYKIYHLNNNFVNRHNIDEIYYRLSDAYTYKSMKLSFYFSFIEDFILAICSISLIFVYSYKIALIVLTLCIFIFIFTYFVLNKNKDIVEKKRIKEYEFYNTYRDSFKNVEDIYINKNESYYNESKNKLLSYQQLDYQYQKLNLLKNYYLMFFQTIIIMVVVLIYFTSLYSYLSVGSLIALINLITLALQPILNLCSQITMFSNIKLIKNRINDIKEN